MKALNLHGWQVSTAEAKEIQLRLAGELRLTDDVSGPSLVAGVDVSPRPGGKARGAVVVLSYPEMEAVESQTAEVEVQFPYVPGLLSFRESPAILAACERLRTTPGLLLVDAQGYAHPRRFGLASHLGLLLDTPSIGCAKSLLCGTHDPVANEA
ncbi:MAG: endonuclease V, partial [Chloroflexota bacterium]